MKFINRERELADLADLWQRTGSQLVVVYGRRRTGKTTLLAQFVRDKPHLFWVADRFPAPTLLGDFSRSIYRLEHPDTAPSPDFTYPDWEMAFRSLGRLAQDRRRLRSWAKRVGLCVRWASKCWLNCGPNRPPCCRPPTGTSTTLSSPAVALPRDW